MTPFFSDKFVLTKILFSLKNFVYPKFVGSWYFGPNISEIMDIRLNSNTNCFLMQRRPKCTCEWCLIMVFVQLVPIRMYITLVQCTHFTCNERRNHIWGFLCKFLLNLSGASVLLLVWQYRNQNLIGQKLHVRCFCIQIEKSGNFC